MARGRTRGPDQVRLARGYADLSRIGRSRFAGRARLGAGSSVIARRRKRGHGLRRPAGGSQIAGTPADGARRTRCPRCSRRETFFWVSLDSASFQGATVAPSGGAGAAKQHLKAAIAIGAAVLLDGLDGRIARMTNTASDFGREMDSLADVISFGIAPAVLAFAWGVQFVDTGLGENDPRRFSAGGLLFAFLFLLCGAMRLARFNIQKNPVPKNPGVRTANISSACPFRRGRWSAVVYACDGEPLDWWPWSVGMAGAVGSAVVSDGQHVALSEL